MIEDDLEQGEALEDKQGDAVKKTSIEIPVMFLKHSLFTKNKDIRHHSHSPLSLQEVYACSHIRQGWLLFKSKQTVIGLSLLLMC